MALQGQGLLVEESDLRRAENLGDMTRREPVRPWGGKCNCWESIMSTTGSTTVSPYCWELTGLAVHCLEVV